MLATLTLETLPDDPAALKELVLEQARRIEQLEHYLAKLRRWQFGSKSERIPEEQLVFSFAGEHESVPLPVERAPRSSARRRSHGRRPIPPEIPQHVTVHDVPEPEQRCPHCGKNRVFIGYDERRRLEYRPACFFQDVHLLKKYVCPPCEKGVVTAPAPGALGPIERGLPGPGLMAQVLVAKFCDHQPCYRQSRIYQRYGVHLSRSTLGDWIAQGTDLLGPIVEAMKKDVLSARMIQTDDTVVHLMEPGLGRCRQGRLWGYLGRGQVVYEFTRSREEKWPLKFLEHYTGGVQCDAYKGYDKLFFRESGRMEFGCFAHDRRYWFEAKETDPDGARMALGFIARLYAVEEEARELSPEKRVALRQEKSRPVLSAFKAWVEKESLRILPKSPMGEAVRYTLGQWEALSRYVDEAEAAIDTNAIERLLRGVALGRKNFMFFGAEEGGHWGAVAYSLIESAKLAGLEPFRYLKDVLMRVWSHPQSRIEELMPRKWRPPPDSS